MTKTVRGAVATRNDSGTAQIGSFDPDDQKVIAYLGLDPRDPKSRAVVAVARHYDLDPLLKHVIVIPKGGVYITRDGYLHVAHRSGQLDGIVVEQEPTLSEDGQVWTARVTVYRKDMSHGFTYPGRYPVAGSNRDYGPEMALKAAESHALRRAFNISGLGAEDEHFPEAEQYAPPAPAAQEQAAAQEPEVAEDQTVIDVDSDDDPLHYDEDDAS